MKSLILFFSFFCTFRAAMAQSLVASNFIPENEVRQVETFLASDDMRGRKTFSPEIEKASDFIINKFKEAGLKPFFANDFKQSFFLYSSKLISATLKLNGNTLPDSAFTIFSGTNQIYFNSIDSFVRVDVSKDLGSAARNQLISKYLRATSVLPANILLVVDPGQKGLIKRLKRFSLSGLVGNQKTVLVVETAAPLTSIFLQAINEVKQQSLNNVAGILRGTEKPEEYIIFSAHYDHLGTGNNSSAMRQPIPGQDSIFNGANDDASGTTAVIELAKYFGKKHLNKRSIIFTTFTAEEIGEYGSQYFSSHIDNKKVIAMFNIEMIGTLSKWGTNSAYITGFERSNFGTLLQANLKSSSFKFYPDPYPEQNLFYRSDNAQLALKGVPAHTISTSKMDDERNYHTPQDEIKTLDLENMTRIIDAIALSSKQLISGKETPDRVAIENE